MQFCNNKKKLICPETEAAEVVQEQEGIIPSQEVVSGFKSKRAAHKVSALYYLTKKTKVYVRQKEPVKLNSGKVTPPKCI